MLVIMLKKVDRDTATTTFSRDNFSHGKSEKKKKRVLDRMVGMMIVIIMNDNFSMKKNVCPFLPKFALLTGTVCTYITNEK